MAKTPRLLKNRKFLIAVYLTILFFVGIIIGILIFLYDQDQGLYSADIEKYDDIQVDLSKSQSNYEKKLDEISLIQTENLTDSQLSTGELDQLVGLHADSKQLLNIVIELNQEILLLDLDESKHSNAQSSINSATDAISNHNKIVEQLTLEIDVTQYGDKMKEALNCYSQIDTDLKSSEIEIKVTGCNEIINSAYTLLPSSFQALKTEEYHNEILNYWNITVELNKQVEAGNEDSAKTLNSNLAESSQRRALLQTESEEEIVRLVELFESSNRED